MSERAETPPAAGADASGPEADIEPLPPHTSWCFGCGPENPEGLQITIGRQGDEVVSRYRFPVRFQGGPGLVHGGAISAVFDDIMGSAMVITGIPGVTARIEVNYRRPIQIGQEVEVRARATGVSGRKIFVEAEMTDADGQRCADAKALFVRVTIGHFVQAAEGAEVVPEQFQPFVEGEYYP